MTPVNKRSIKTVNLVHSTPLAGFGSYSQQVNAAPGVSIDFVSGGVLVCKFGIDTYISFANILSITLQPETPPADALQANQDAPGTTQKAR